MTSSLRSPSRACCCAHAGSRSIAGTTQLTAPPASPWCPPRTRAPRAGRSQHWRAGVRAPRPRSEATAPPGAPRWRRPLPQAPAGGAREATSNSAVSQRQHATKNSRTDSSSTELNELYDSPAPLALDMHRAPRSSGAARHLRRTGHHPRQKDSQHTAVSAHSPKHVLAQAPASPPLAALRAL